MPLLSGHEAVPLGQEELAQQEEHFVGFTHGLVRLTPGKWFLPAAFTNFADKIYNFQWRSDDVLVMAYPRSGTSWLQEVVWTMKNNPDLENPMADMPLLARSPYVDMDMMMDGRKMPPLAPDNPLLQGFIKMCPGGNPADGVNLQLTAATPSPRIIKTHLPLSLLHPNLLDTIKPIMTMYDRCGQLAPPAEVCKKRKKQARKKRPQARFPPVVYGPYWRHVKEAWEKREAPNLHFVFYEDLKADPASELKRLGGFLGCDLAKDQLENLIRYTSFAEMQARDNVMGVKSAENPVMNQGVVKEDGGFFRKGEVGSWKERLSAEASERLEQWAAKNLEGIPFKYI
ncbi:LOW QUALITY PROTEIN: sulfotransferase 1A1-like [Penaeus monodon]|uniref:LOW QUALITY PROTEIN: sulfotransferase 1A1-like n=1 Tax=Penaeus monodon TaxID=6687 RepID=UPI0018A771D2|nr:LOW QUALITY PROTEIN: sulfotransferase 1A1-like [Penaeus monodon]